MIGMIIIKILIIITIIMAMIIIMVMMIITKIIKNYTVQKKVEQVSDSSLFVKILAVDVIMEKNCFHYRKKSTLNQARVEMLF